jgi:hypothetical protein
MCLMEFGVLSVELYVVSKFCFEFHCPAIKLQSLVKVN